MAPLDGDLEALAKACAETDPENEFELDDDPWQHLSELVDDDPEAALAVSLRVTGLTGDMHVLSVLGAGAIEELLIRQPAMLEAVLLGARRSPNFRSAFRCVWTGGMSHAVRVKVDEALKLYGGNL